MSINDRVVLDSGGFPVLLANVPNAGVSNISVGTVSGNPRHDSRSGKFGAGKKERPRRTPTPANTDPHEFARMYAAARDAAREFDQLVEGDVREFLKGRAANPDQVDIANFMSLVRQQRINDLADLLDQQFRITGPMARGRRKVKVSAPKGYTRKAVNNLTPDEVNQLKNVLASRGHDQGEVDKWFAAKGHVVLSDVEYDPDDDVRVDIGTWLINGFQSALAEMPPPQITVEVPPPPVPQPVTRIVHRDEHGLIESIEET